jgi:hypothetical protein
MSLLLLHASMMSMGGIQILISTCCSCNYIAWVHFTEFGKCNFDILVPLLKQQGCSISVAQSYRPVCCSPFCSDASCQCMPLLHLCFLIFSLMLFGCCTLGHCQKCKKLTAYYKARNQCTHHYIQTDILSCANLPIFIKTFFLLNAWETWIHIP